LPPAECPFFASAFLTRGRDLWSAFHCAKLGIHAPIMGDLMNFVFVRGAQLGDFSSRSPRRSTFGPCVAHLRASPPSLFPLFCFFC